MEERVAGQHPFAVCDEPVVQIALLFGQRVQVVPDVGTSTGRPHPGDTQGCAVTVRERLELIELGDVLPGHHHADLGVGEPRLVQVLERLDRHRIRPRAAHCVVHLGGRAIE